MNEFWAIVYGIIQGLTEFLPVSSSGHLALLPRFAKFDDPGLVFDLAMHLGTALAVALYFYKDLLRLIKNCLNFILPNKTCDGFTKNFIIATFATGVLGLLLKSHAESFGRQGDIIAVNLIVFGILLFLADKWGLSRENVMEDSKSWKKAFLIGLLQVIAIFPGVSRSGITMTGGRILGLSKKESSSFSFLLSLPLIVAGAILKFKEIFETGESFNYSLCFIGIVVSFFTGYATIHFFLKLLKKIEFSYFMIYRIILGVAVLIFV